MSVSLQSRGKENGILTRLLTQLCSITLSLPLTRPTNRPYIDRPFCFDWIQSCPSPNATTSSTPPPRCFIATVFHATGIDRILGEAGVAKMTLYNHFKSKDELILAALHTAATRSFAAGS